MMAKILVITHKQLYFSRATEKYSSIGGFSTWNNHLSMFVKELHILAPVKQMESSPKGATYLDNRIKVHHGLHRGTDIIKTIAYTMRIARKNDIDITVCKIPGFIGFAGVMGSQLSRKPTTLQVLGDWLEIQRLMPRANFPLKILTGLIVRFLLIFTSSLSDIIIAEAFSIKNNLVRLGINTRKIFVIPESSIDEAFFRPLKKTYQSACKTILYVGRLSREKGLFILINAVYLLRKKYGYVKGFKLVILGDGKIRSTLERKIKDYKLDGLVELRGVVTHREVLHKLNQCYLLVLPSLSEGRGKILMEAMAAAKPVVSTYVGGIPEIVKDGVNGLLVKPNDPSALAEALHKLLDSESLSSKLGKEGRRNAEAYKLEKILPSYISLISRLLKRSTAFSV